MTMERDSIRYRTDLLCEDGVIAEIGRSLSVPQGCQVFDCAGKYLLPGLFDAHIHISSSDMLPMLLACGVTAVRHLSGGEKVKALIENIQAGVLPGPAIYGSGRIYDGRGGPSDSQNHRFIENEEQAEQAVYDTIEEGWLWIKTYPAIPPNLYKRLMDTANACGIKVCGHMAYQVDAKQLRDWGYHCCEHSSSMPRHHWDSRYLAESGMWLCPTQAVCETLPDYVWNDKKLSDLPEWRYVPSYLKARWEEQNLKIAKGYKDRDLRPDINEVIARGRAFMEYSERFMAGSDAMYPGMIAGFSLHDELEKLVSLYGCTPYESLKSATVNPAAYIGIENRKGALKVGTDADILILRENPLANIKNTRAIHAVILGGRVIERPELDAMLSEAASINADQVMFYEDPFI